MRVLVIEDSADIVEAVTLCLQSRWPEVTFSFAAEGTKGIEILESGSFDIVLLDINLPDMNGFEVLSRIRSFSDVPVIIVSVRRSEVDRARGLEMGADDYIVKPFTPVDLVARVNALLRRAHAPKVTEEQPCIVRGDLTLNLAAHEAYLRGETVRLTPTEYKLLYVLMKNAERTLSSGQISQQVWGEEQAYTESVRAYIRRLRHKLKDTPPQMILTDHGEGYRFIGPR